MKFSAIVAAGFAAVANAVQLANGPADFVGLKTGGTFAIKWIDAVGPVTLTLQHGDPNHLQTVQVIQSGLSGSEYDWSIPNLPVDSAYAIRIDDGSGVPNYSVLFAITGGTGSFSTGSTSAPASTSATSSSSAASSSASSASTTSSGSSTTSASSSQTTSATSSKTTSSAATTTSAKPTTTITNNNDARRFSSPLALVLVTVAALVYFN